MNVNSRYLAMRGITVDVGGKIFDIRRRKTTRASRIDMDKVIFSPASVGK
jgi:hypothetical protein